MEQYIDKAAIVAEIERRIKTNKECMLGLRNLDYYQGKVDALNDTNSFLNTLEVKRVDLDFMLHEYWNISPKICVDCLESATMTKDEMINFAKHFFELGLNSSIPMTWEDIRNIDHILDGMRNENQVFGYPKFHEEALRRFKAMKGE